MTKVEDITRRKKDKVKQIFASIAANLDMGLIPGSFAITLAEQIHDSETLTLDLIRAMSEETKS